MNKNKKTKKKYKIEDEIFEGKPTEVIGVGEEEDLAYCDISDSDENSEGSMYAMVSRENRAGKMFIRSWRAWLRFLAEELRSELYEQVPDKYMKQFESEFDNIRRYINLAVAGEDRFFLDEKLIG
jgi:hypothetical protein